ncbi:MAG: TolC family protein [Arcobacter sp.]|nr:TolC family protein [Arcobacter sp.]
MKVNKKVLIFISTVFLFSNLNAKDVVLEELIDIAIQNNSDIKIGKYKENIKDSNYKNSKANYLPKVSTKAELANYEITSMGNRVDDNVTGISLTVNQLIYDFGKTFIKFTAMPE